MVAADNVKVIKELKTPENRKDLYYMWEEQIRDSIASGSTSKQIETLIHIIRQITPELDNYQSDTWFDLMPSYKEVRDGFLKEHPLLIPEMEYSLIPQINRARNELYLRRLQRETMKLFEMLTHKVDWLFMKSSRGTAIR